MKVAYKINNKVFDSIPKLVRYVSALTIHKNDRATSGTITEEYEFDVGLASAEDGWIATDVNWKTTCEYQPKSGKKIACSLMGTMHYVDPTCKECMEHLAHLSIEAAQVGAKAKEPEPDSDSTESKDSDDSEAGASGDPNYYSLPLPKATISDIPDPGRYAPGTVFYTVPGRGNYDTWWDAFLAAYADMLMRMRKSSGMVPKYVHFLKYIAGEDSYHKHIGKPTVRVSLRTSFFSYTSDYEFEDWVEYLRYEILKGNSLTNTEKLVILRGMLRENELYRAAVKEAREKELPIQTWLRTFKLTLTDKDGNVFDWAEWIFKDLDLTKSITMEDGVFVLKSRNPEVFWTLLGQPKPKIHDDKMKVLNSIILNEDGEWSNTDLKPIFKSIHIRYRYGSSTMSIGNAYELMAYCGRIDMLARYRLAYNGYISPAVDNGYVEFVAFCIWIRNLDAIISNSPFYFSLNKQRHEQNKLLHDNYHDLTSLADIQRMPLLRRIKKQYKEGNKEIQFLVNNLSPTELMRYFKS